MLSGFPEKAGRNPARQEIHFAYKAIGGCPLRLANQAAVAGRLAATASCHAGSAAKPSYQRPISEKRATGSPKYSALGTKAPIEKSAMVSRSPINQALSFK